MLICLVQWWYFWVDGRSTKVKSVEGEHTASVQTSAPSTEEQCHTGVCRCISPALPWVQQPGAAASCRALSSVQECRERLTCQAAWQALLWVFPGAGCRGVRECCADSAREMFPLSVPWKQPPWRRLQHAGTVVPAVPLPQECSAGSWSAWWPPGPWGPSLQSGISVSQALCGPVQGIIPAWEQNLVFPVTELMTVLSAHFHSLSRTL